jgi:malate dehydrogenase (oxaloacetate-decarboxylating)(NADP+)
MGIPIGKLALYCAAGGIAPHRVLPITIDVGTNNQSLLQDPHYIGIRQPRCQNDHDYYEILDEFMQAIFHRWKDVIIQFEDFETTKAVTLLDKYRNNYRCFNDDIQGTGAVTLAGLLSASKIANHSFIDSKIVCVGMGSAGLGVCSQILEGLIAAGLTREEARSRFVLVSIDGAFGRNDNHHNTPHPHYTGKSRVPDDFQHWCNPAIVDGTNLVETIRQFQPNILLGLSATGGIFTPEILQLMDTINPITRPIIMPMSNPTSRSECTAEDAYIYTRGRAIVATGSPFPPVIYQGMKLTPSQCNNMYIFPGIGLAASVSGITRITDNMLYQGALACAESTSATDIAAGRVFPEISSIRDVAWKVATAIIEEGIRENLTTKIKKHHIHEGIANFVKRKMYYPVYVPLL